MTFTIANLLTLTRLVLAPIFVASFLAGREPLAIILFCIAGFTDLIDGSVARLLKQPSKSGAIFDPIADKMLMQSCFTLLFLEGLLPVWFFFLALARDVTIVGGIIYLERRRADLPYRPLWVSKAATAVQLCVGILGLLRWWRPGVVWAGVPLITWHATTIIVAAVLVVTSYAQYVQMGFEILRKESASGRRSEP